MASRKVSRRRFVAGTAALSTAMVAAPFVRGAYAAGKLSLGFWDHWVPGANKTSEALIKEWAAKEKVDVTIDYITSQGNKLLLTTAAESQAKSGHDVLAFSTWLPSRYADQLVPMNDVVEPLIKENGAVNATVEYLGKVGGKWLAVPATIGSQMKGPCSRIDMLKQHAGIDIQAMYPAGSAPKADGWTLDTFMKAAEACHKAGASFGIGLGTTSDSVDTAGAIFHSFGAQLVNAKGDITVKSDNVRKALDYYKRLMSFLPEDAPAWDDASNNKWLVSGKGALIMNPPSAWAVAKRDAPKVAEQCWTHGFPAGPAGRFGPFLPFFWGTWNFSKNQSAAKSLMVFLSQKSSAEQLVAASGGYDLPSFANFTTFKTWADEGPPTGTLYHYPNPFNHQTLSIAAAPAPHKIAEQIYTQAIQTQMVVRHFKGEAMDRTLDWAAKEIEGFSRN
ncbi:MAG: ABC transporter substrate-binding protein [Reyranella sp.]|jgi:ABC-type glycerol-3-phosphate transport system substrate-binding protein|nr:ABC transporter substrate-binding protein [Reyranella sp.]